MGIITLLQEIYQLWTYFCLRPHDFIYIMGREPKDYWSANACKYINKTYTLLENTYIEIIVPHHIWCEHCF